MLKTYELTDRHFGWEQLPKPAPEAGDARTICSSARCDRRGW